LTNFCILIDTLGNAHLTNFFTNNESTEQLELALKAYAQSEKWMKIGNPDLFCNRATILEYLERYAEAIRDYNVAHSIDPTL
jgi:tetratricopeptide (TPR) repeat protein